MRFALGRPATVAATLVLAATLATSTSATPAAAGRSTTATAQRSSVEVHRGGPDARVTFHRSGTGQVFLTVTASARRVSWADRGNTSAVVSAYVDGHYATDIVIMSSSPVTRQFALGKLGAGRHTLRLHYSARRSSSDAGEATLQGFSFTTVAPSSPAYAVARYAPVLYGRNIASLGGPFENNRTDTPLVAWHRVLPADTPGHHVIEYSVMWSNEDGGTSTPALMAQWGRTTDIEWIYRVEVDAQGHRVPGSGVFQSPAHGTQTFQGTYDGTHPLLQTCTSNNNVCDSAALRALAQRKDPMRFALSTRNALPADQPREHEMDIHPWTYQVMAQEMKREHKIESPSNPATPSVGDQRTYLYIAVTHATAPPGSAGGIGLAVDVKLKGDTTTYTSNHDVSLWVINRDGPAATTVELPAGTRRGDIASISVRRVPVTATDDDATLTVTDLDRAFFLGSDYLPKASFAAVHGAGIMLTTAEPTQQIWPAA
jgi:hypothetical protein